MLEIHRETELLLWYGPSGRDKPLEQVAAAAQLLDEAHRGIVLEAAQKRHDARQPAALRLSLKLGIYTWCWRCWLHVGRLSSSAAQSTARMQLQMLRVLSGPSSFRQRNSSPVVGGGLHGVNLSPHVAMVAPLEQRLVIALQDHRLPVGVSAGEYAAVATLVE